MVLVYNETLLKKVIILIIFNELSLKIDYQGKA